MSIYLKIEGNSVKRVREEVEKTVDLAEFVASIESNVPVESGMLPRNCIYFCQLSGRFVYVVEIAAQLINASTRQSNNGLKHYKIHIPFTQFYICGNPITGALGQLFITATKRPLRSLTEQVLLPPYPNIFNQGTGHICTGSMNVPQKLPIDAKINVICSEFFTAAFNSDLQPGMPEGWSWRGGVDPYMEHWAELTTQNRCLMLSDGVKMHPYPRTPEAIIADCLRGVEG